jgi:signal transduction histidine kinase
MSHMSNTARWGQRLKKEIEAVALTTLYFLVWLGALVLIKKLILDQYQIQFRGVTVALFGALVIAKVVLVLEYVPLGRWISRHAVLVDIVLRTLLYTLGVAIVMLLEKAFEVRHEAGGFGAALVHVFDHRDVAHVWANVIGVGGALLVFNVLSVLRRQVAGRKLVPFFLKPPSE